MLAKRDKKVREFEMTMYNLGMGNLIEDFKEEDCADVSLLMMMTEKEMTQFGLTKEQKENFFNFLMTQGNFIIPSVTLRGTDIELVPRFILSSKLCVGSTPNPIMYLTSNPQYAKFAKKYRVYHSNEKGLDDFRELYGGVYKNNMALIDISALKDPQLISACMNVGIDLEKVSFRNFSNYHFIPEGKTVYLSKI